MNLLPSFSVVICSKDALKFTHASECYEQLLANFPHEIIAIHDARSLAEGYNRALRRARGDIVIFSHDDVLIIDPDFAQKISHRLRDFDILGFAGTRRVVADIWWRAGFPWLSGAVTHIRDRKLNLNHWNPEPWPVVDDIQGIDGLCIMARREVAKEIGFDETTFDGFHLYDLDFSFSAWRAGKKLGVCCDIPVIHASWGKYGKVHAHYGRLFIEKHRDTLPTNEQKIDKIVGTFAIFSDHNALCEVWREDVMRRNWIAFQKNEEEVSGQFRNVFGSTSTMK
ncbi:MAG: glycosyltransferase family protein [Betaproteobacteria bacterium]|nr:glycosyltransferase family protein [Betaproteobacteria bacterium]